MRCCLSFLVVEHMRLGNSPQQACQMGIQRILTLKKKHKNNGNDNNSVYNDCRLTVAVIAMDRCGNIGAASTLGDENNLTKFPYVCWDGTMDESSFITMETGMESVY